MINLKQKIKPGSVSHLKKEAVEYLSNKNIKPEYVEIAEAGNLKAIEEWDGTTELVALAAAFIGDVRLIDNILLKD